MGRGGHAAPRFQLLSPVSCLLPNMKRFKLLLATVAALACATAALGQITPTTTAAFTGQAATVATATTDKTPSAAIAVPQGRGLAVLATIGGTAATTNGAVTFTFAVSADGTNYSTDTSLQLAITPTGTNVLTGYKNFASTTLDNVAWIRLASVQNAAAGTVTNLSLVYSRRN